MASAPYGGMIFAGLWVLGGVLQAQALPRDVPNNTDIPSISLGTDEVTRIKDIRAACGTESFEASETMPGSAFTLRVALYENGRFTPPTVTIAKGAGQEAMPLIQVKCSAQWAMLEVMPGTYTLSAHMADGTLRTAQTLVPVAGMARVVIGTAPDSAPVS